MRMCIVCSNPRVAEVDAALIGTEPYRSVALRFNVPPGSVFRHQKKHLSATLLKAKAAADIAAGDTLMEQVEELKSMARRLGKKAEDAGDYRGALAAVRELVRVVELVGKLTGQLGGDQAPTGPRVGVIFNFPVATQEQLDAVNNAPVIDLPPMARRLLTRPSDGHQR